MGDGLVSTNYMSHTKLVYLEDMSLVAARARVFSSAEEEGRSVVVLDETIFYPQGGGQPYDQGVITTASARFLVEEVRFVEGIVRHIGKYEAGTFSVGDEVECLVDSVRRELHARLHSAGHIIDLAVHSLGLSWIPGKGFHFPQGPYIEYAGDLAAAGDGESLRKKIEEKAQEIVNQASEVTVRFMPKEEMHMVCHSVPDYLPSHKPTRVVMYGVEGIPCGGTHVSNLGKVGHITIRKIKKEKDALRVAYAVE